MASSNHISVQYLLMGNRFTVMKIGIIKIVIAPKIRGLPPLHLLYESPRDQNRGPEGGKDN
jgi:hypothetical protein